MAVVMVVMVVIVIVIVIVVVVVVMLVFFRPIEAHQKRSRNLSPRHRQDRDPMAELLA